MSYQSALLGALASIGGAATFYKRSQGKQEHEEIKSSLAASNQYEQGKAAGMQESEPKIRSAYEEGKRIAEELSAQREASIRLEIDQMQKKFEAEARNKAVDKLREAHQKSLVSGRVMRKAVYALGQSTNDKG